jgi:hypothetical protein
VCGRSRACAVDARVLPVGHPSRCAGAAGAPSALVPPIRATRRLARGTDRRGSAPRRRSTASSRRSASPLRYSYTREDRIRALIDVAARVREPLTSSRYTAERLKIHEESRERGELVSLPSADTIRDFFGSWKLALEAAGLPTVATHVPPFTGGTRPSYTREKRSRLCRRHGQSLVNHSRSGPTATGVAPVPRPDWTPDRARPVFRRPSETGR